MAVALLVAIPLTYRFRLFDEPDLLRMLLVGMVFSALTLSSAELEKRGFLRIPVLMRNLGDSSYSTYLAHILVLGVLGKFWATIGPWPDTLLDNWLLVFLAILACSAYGWLAYLVIERPLMQTTSRLSKTYFPSASFSPTKSS